MVLLVEKNKNTQKQKFNLSDENNIIYKDIYCKYNNFFNQKDEYIISQIDIFDFLNSIGKDIENSFPSQVIKKSGKYCTSNIEIVDLIINNTVDFSNILNKQILEPSCGYGIFILRLIYFLEKKQYSKDEIVYFVNNNIFGFDISPVMVHFSILNIKLYLSYLYKDFDLFYQINPKIFVSDSTYKPQNSELNLLESLINFVETDEAKQIKLKAYNGEFQFDYVIGNPPYVTLYGRRDNKKSEILREYYIKNYNFVPCSVKNGKFNLLMFFFEQSIDWLKEGALMSFIVDVSIFETAYCYLRKYLLERTKIKTLIIEIDAFNVASGQIIILLQKSTNKHENMINNISVINYQNQKNIIFKQADWYKENNEYKFEIIDNKTNEILKKIEKKSKPLSNFYTGKKLRTCCMLLNMEDLFTTKELMDSENSLLPYYEGSKSLKNKYGNLLFTRYFIYNKKLQDEINDKLKADLTIQGIKNKKRIGLGDLRFYNSPKLFIRQSAKEIIASLSVEPSCANNSLYCLSEGLNSEQSIQKLKITCSQLNSTLLTFYALAKRIIRTCKGKQPQIKIADLKNIPLNFDFELSKKLLCLYEDYIETNDNNILEEINNLLYSYYELNSEEIAFINRFVENF